MNYKKVMVIGAGLAGSEAAWMLAKYGIDVDLYEMKPQRFSVAHKNPDFAELVCSNSLRSDDFLHNAVGLMHEEMRRAGSLVMEVADKVKVPAGGALAVDREGFAKQITERLKNSPYIHIIHEEVETLPTDPQVLCIVATGPLTAEKLASDIQSKVADESLCFYDAIAPVVYTESIDFNKAWYQSRYDKGDKTDYINCPLNKSEYENFVSALLTATKTEFHDFETPNYFDGCLPIEVMAARGVETLRFGPMKPVGLTNPHLPEKPYAVVQLRQDNAQDTLRNMVGFQTKLKYGEQQRIFRTIPGLEHAEFARLGGIHKNTFIKSPILLDSYLHLKSQPNIMFAGQITGCEGYVESASVGMMAGYFAACLMQEKEPILPPCTTAFGAMLAHLRDAQNIDSYQPMNINFGLFPPLTTQKNSNGTVKHLKGAEKKEAYAQRALQDIDNFVKSM